MDISIDSVPATKTASCTRSLRRGALLGIFRAFAYELVARGELPAIRLGRRRLIPKVALNALIGLERMNQTACNALLSQLV